jgi:hypothetical protein
VRLEAEEPLESLEALRGEATAPDWPSVPLDARPVNLDYRMLLLEGQWG